MKIEVTSSDFPIDKPFEVKPINGFQKTKMAGKHKSFDDFRRRLVMSISGEGRIVGDGSSGYRLEHSLNTFDGQSKSFKTVATIEF